MPQFRLPNRRNASVLRATAALFALGGSMVTSTCVEFNECESTRGDRIGAAAIDLDVRESIVRRQEAPIGNLIADSLLVTAKSLCDEGGFPCPILAMQNAGGIREETACGQRESIEAGSIWEADVIDLMPFENELLVVRLTGEDIRLALERGVSQLGQIGEAGAAGYFLQVAGVTFDVDCAGEGQTIRADQSGIENPGTRVSNIAADIGGVSTLLDDTLEYEVALNSYIAGGRDGFLSFLLRDGLSLVVDGDGEPAPKATRDQDVVKTVDGSIVTDRAAVMAYVRSSDAVDIPVGRPPEGRIRINEACYAGPIDDD